MMIMIIVDKLVSSIVIIMMVMIKIIVDNLVSALLLLSPSLYATSSYMYLLYMFLRHIVL